MTNTYCVCTVLRYSWWWTVDLSETCRVLYQINSIIVHLVGFHYKNTKENLCLCEQYMLSPWTVHVITVKCQISHAYYHSFDLAYSWSIRMLPVNSTFKCIIKCFSIHQIPTVTDSARLLSVPRGRSISVSRTSSHLFSKASLDSTKICSVAKAWWWWRIWILSSWWWSCYSGWSWSRKSSWRTFPI